MSDEAVQQEEREKQLTVAYRQTFGTESGRRVLKDLVERFPVLHPTWDPNPYAASFNEGQRAAVLWILNNLGSYGDAVLNTRQFEQDPYEEVTHGSR